jgi:hypothetical protein
VLTSDQKGSIAEAEIVCAAMKLGIGVYRPVTGGERYDLIFDRRPRLMRVQCKWAPLQQDVIVLRCYSSCRSREGSVRRIYEANELDAYAAYCVETDCCYFVPVDGLSARTQLLLRLSPPRNNQLEGINWAKDFEFAAKLGGSGAVAQLGERRAGSA